MRYTLVLYLMLISTVLTGCGDDESKATISAETYVDQGWKEYIAGNYDGAIAKFQEALKIDPNNPEAYNGIGWSKGKQGKSMEAIENFKSAIVRDPNNIDAYVGLSGIYLALGDYERAIASAKPALGTNYKSFHDNIDVRDVRIILAQCYYNLGDYSSAKKELDIAGISTKSLDPSQPSYALDLLRIIQSASKKE